MPNRSASLAQPFGQDAIFRARRDIPGGMIVGTDPGAGIHQDQRLEDFTRMDDGQGERPGGHDIDADEPMFRIQATDQELFPIQASKQGSEEQRRLPPKSGSVPPPEWHGPRARG